jgi:hypothetical protein
MGPPSSKSRLITLIDLVIKLKRNGINNTALVCAGSFVNPVTACLLLGLENWSPAYSMPRNSACTRKVQKSINLQYVRNFFITYRIYKNYSNCDLQCSVHNSQRYKLHADLNLNISVDAIKYFRFNNFRVTLYTLISMWVPEVSFCIPEHFYLI